MYITSVEELDSLLNMGDTMIDSHALSPEMDSLLADYNSGMRAMREKNLLGAIGIFNGVLAKSPQFVAPRYHLANCQFALGDPQSALLELRKANLLAPKDLDVHMLMARIFDSLGDKDNEIAQYHKMLKIDPENISVLNNLGVTYRTSGKYDLAVEWLTKALQYIERDNKYASPFQPPDRNQELATLQNLATAYQSLNDWDQAVYCWKRCVEIAPVGMFLRSLHNAEQERDKRKY
jgi:tetratricopeptide (TPR) repeat protein